MLCSVGTCRSEVLIRFPFPLSSFQSSLIFSFIPVWVFFHLALTFPSLAVSALKDTVCALLFRPTAQMTRCFIQYGGIFTHSFPVSPLFLHPTTPSIHFVNLPFPPRLENYNELRGWQIFMSTQRSTLFLKKMIIITSKQIIFKQPWKRL